jgi:hypothetical protein
MKIQEIEKKARGAKKLIREAEKVQENARVKFQECVEAAAKELFGVEPGSIVRVFRVFDGQKEYMARVERILAGSDHNFRIRPELFVRPRKKDGTWSGRIMYVLEWEAAA